MRPLTKRIDTGDPDEYCFECPDCEGEGSFELPDDEIAEQDKCDDDWQPGVARVECERCDGLGRVFGDADDGWYADYRAGR